MKNIFLFLIITFSYINIYAYNYLCNDDLKKTGYFITLKMSYIPNQNYLYDFPYEGKYSFYYIDSLDLIINKNNQKDSSYLFLYSLLHEIGFTSVFINPYHSFYNGCCKKNDPYYYRNTNLEEVDLINNKYQNDDFINKSLKYDEVFYNNEIKIEIFIVKISMSYCKCVDKMNGVFYNFIKSENVILINKIHSFFSLTEDEINKFNKIFSY